MTRNAGSLEILRILTPTRGSVRLAGSSLSMGFGLGWAILLTVGGGLLASAAPGSVVWLAGTMLFGGLTLALAGLFVFILSVSGRVFPGASPRLKRNSEVVLGVAILLGLACTALTLVS